MKKSYLLNDALGLGFIKNNSQNHVAPTTIIVPYAEDGRHYGPVIIGENTVIDDYVIISSGTIIGKNCFIGAGQVIGHRTHLIDGTRLERLYQPPSKTD